MWMSCADLNCRSRSNLAYRRSAFLSGGNDLDVVWLEPGIGRRDRNPFRLRLRNEETVKRVAMMKREPCDANGMAKLNRNRVRVRHRQSFRNVLSGGLGSGSLPMLYLIAISQTLAAESSNSFRPS